jgi:hypothetical protein
MVKYMHTVNKKYKFLDLGTHVFYKFPVTLRPWSQYNFNLVNVMDDGIDESYATYLLSLSDGMKNYYALND